jgi:hypothetical protein
MSKRESSKSTSRKQKLISKEKVTAAKAKFADVKLSKEDKEYVLIFEINILDGIKFQNI